MVFADWFSCPVVAVPFRTLRTGERWCPERARSAPFCGRALRRRGSGGRLRPLALGGRGGGGGGRRGVPVVAGRGGRGLLAADAAGPVSRAAGDSASAPAFAATGCSCVPSLRSCPSSVSFFVTR